MVAGTMRKALSPNTAGAQRPADAHETAATPGAAAAGGSGLASLFSHAATETQPAVFQFAPKADGMHAADQTRAKPA